MTQFYTNWHKEHTITCDKYFTFTTSSISPNLISNIKSVRGWSVE